MNGDVPELSARRVVLEYDRLHTQRFARNGLARRGRSRCRFAHAATQDSHAVGCLFEGAYSRTRFSNPPRFTINMLDITQANGRSVTVYSQGRIRTGAGDLRLDEQPSRVVFTFLQQRIRGGDSQ